MRVAIMQPYFFPYIGYFQLITAVDKFIISDNVQYIKRGWINRNRVLKPQKGWQYINAPLVKHSSKDLIKNVKVIKNSDWKDKVISQLGHYKKSAPFYREVEQLVASCLSNSETSITKLNIHILKGICDYIRIRFEAQLETEMNFDYSLITHTGLRPLRSLQLGASEYINPIGGVGLYHKDELARFGLKLSFLQSNITAYNQGRSSFEPHMSIIDVLMFNDPVIVSTMINDYQLV